MKNLITYEDALELVEVYNNFNFFKSEYILNGYKVVTFSYFLCEFNHFENPIKYKPEVKAYDVRGLTFVFDKDGSLYKRFLMLPKFFNLNQVEITQYCNVKDKKIKSITEKEDGSLVAFMNLPDGTVFAKTIGSFDNDQTRAAMKIFNNDDKIQTFIKAFLNDGYTPIFEYVSWDNRIVLKYTTPQLRLIGLRNNENGTFLPGPLLEIVANKNNIIVTKEIKEITLDQLIEKSKIEEEKEGWVVEFEDGQLMKIKTEWYFRIHGIRTMSIFREDYVIKNYLEQKLDDILSQLDINEDVDAFKFVDKVKLAVDNHLKYIDEYVKVFVDKFYNEYEENWVKFATENHKTAFFNLIKIMIEKPELYNKRKVDFVIENTKFLNKAKYFVEKWSNV